MLFDRRRPQDSEETAGAPRPRFIVIATAIGGDTWDITIPELMGSSTMALSEREIESSARQRIAAHAQTEPGDFDIDVRRIEYPRSL